MTPPPARGGTANHERPKAMTQDQPQLSAIAPWFGGKRTLAPAIVDLFGPLDRCATFVDAFHGSLPVTIEMRRRGYAGPIIANDLFALVHNLACVLIDLHKCEQLMAKLAAVPFHERAWSDSIRGLLNIGALHRPIAVLPEKCAVTAAAACLNAWWMGRNGEAGLELNVAEMIGDLRGFCVRWTASGGDPALRWQHVKESIPTWYRLLTGGKTTFLQRDANGVLASLSDDAGLWIYADPPYLHETRGTARYAVDVEDATGGFREDVDFHSRLAEQLWRFRKATVVVSYYAHERLDRLYPRAAGWKHIDATMTKATAQASAGASGEGKAPEVLIVRRGS